jgi:hypothetical protein
MKYKNQEWVKTTVQIKLLEFRSNCWSSKSFQENSANGKIEKYADSVDKNYISNNHLHLSLLLRQLVAKYHVLLVTADGKVIL